MVSSIGAIFRLSLLAKLQRLGFYVSRTPCAGLNREGIYDPIVHTAVSLLYRTGNYAINSWVFETSLYPCGDTAINRHYDSMCEFRQPGFFVSNTFNPCVMYQGRVQA